MTDTCLIYVTCKDQEEAQQIAQRAIHQKLAACANIFQPHLSIYEWDGEIQQSAETCMILKTKVDCVEPLKDLVIKMHSYDTPCFIVVDIADGAAPFLEWIKAQTQCEV